MNYIVRIWKSGVITMGCEHIGHDGNIMFKSLESYGYEGGVTAGDIYGHVYPMGRKGIGHRFPTQIEIEVFKRFGTLTNIQQDIRDYKLELLDI